MNEKKFQKFKNMNRLIFEPNGWQNTLADGEERYSYQDNIRMDDGDQKVSINPVIKVYSVYRAENDPEGSHGKITTRVITPVY